MKPNPRAWLCCAAIVAVAVGAPAQAAIKTQLIDYKQGDATLQGYLAYDDANTNSALSRRHASCNASADSGRSPVDSRGLRQMRY